MSTKNPDQFFRLAYVVFRFFLLVIFTTIPFGGLAWWKMGSFKSALPIVVVILLIALAVSLWDYTALGEKMRAIEAKKNAIVESESEETDTSPSDASKPPSGV